MRNRTEHGFSRLTAISDAGSTPAASTNDATREFLSRLAVSQPAHSMGKHGLQNCSFILNGKLGTQSKLPGSSVASLGRLFH